MHKRRAKSLSLLPSGSTLRKLKSIALTLESNPREYLAWLSRTHDRLTRNYIEWGHKNSAEIFGYSISDWLERYAVGSTVRTNPPTGEQPVVTSKYADFHHVHFMCPRDLWYRFRSRFPNKGDVQIRMVEALTVYVDLLKESEKHKEVTTDATTSEG